MTRNVSRALALLVTCTVGSRAAHAERLLFESYVGSRPADAARLAPLIRSVFEQHGFTVDPLVLAMYFREHAHRPGLVSPKLADVLKRTERRAEDDFWDEKYLKVIDDLRNLMIWMRQNPQVFAREPKHRETALRVLVFYALACERQARVLTDKPDEAARFARLRDDTMAEIIRSYPSKVITTKDFGEEGERLFLKIRDQINQSGRGKLSIAVSDPDAVIYINEIVVGTAKVNVGDFVPGIYRVLIVMPTGEGRQYEVEVAANQTARLVVDWDTDSLLVLDVWAGFRYPTEKEHAREATLVHLLSQSHTNADIAATVTVTHTHGRLAVIGTSYNTRSGKILHTGSVELVGSPANDTMLNRLADCLVGKPCAEGVLPVSHPEYTPPPLEPEIADPAPVVTPRAKATVDTTETRSSPSWLATGGPAAAVMGAGALVVTGGAVAYVRSSYDPSRPPSDGTDGKNPAVEVMLGGSVIFGGGVYWWSRRSLSADRLTAGALGAGVTLVAAGLQLYLVAQEPSYALPRYIRRTATDGAIAGFTGIALTGAGLWRVHRQKASASSPAIAARYRKAPIASWMPFVSAGSSQTLLGCAGNF